MFSFPFLFIHICVLAMNNVYIQLPFIMRPICLKTLLLLGLVFTFTLASAGSPKRKIRKADRKYDRYFYYKALQNYQKAAEKDPTNAKVNLRIADCYRHLNMPLEAEKWYREALEYPENAADGQNHLHLIRAMMNNGHYADATTWASNYLAAHPGDELTMNLKEGSESYPIYLKDSTRFKVTNLDINTPESDFGSTIHDGSVIFSSAQEQDKLVFGWNGRYFLQLYAGEIGEGTFQLEEIDHLPGLVNTKFHEAIVTFSPEGDVMYFTRNNFNKGKRGLDAEGATLLKIYKTEMKKGKWKKPVGMHFNSDDYSVGHPSLSADGQVMYFTSDMPGGYGGTDIYKTMRSGDGWGEPINLGPGINTPATEMFPWISPENELYFASSGHPGLGGLDVFVAKMEGQTFGTPKNFGAPINSSRDDFHMVWNDSKTSGYFSSNRPGGKGDDDIYSFAARNYMYKGLVVDKITQEPIDMALVQMSDNGMPRILNFSDREGLFNFGLDSLFDWDVIVAAEGYQVERVNLKDAGTNEEGLMAKFELVRCGDSPVEDTTVGPAVVLSGVLKDDDGNPVRTGKVRIIREIDVADAEFETMLDPGADYRVEVESPEYPDLNPRVYDITTNVDENQEIPLEAIFSKDELPPGRVFYIIYYDFDKYNIRERDARPELDRVVNMMKAYPEVSIELSSHTDSRATYMYNETLSKNRAVSAQQYIINKGISKDRISKKWMGERELTNPCADGVECSEDDHQLNRRTEFKILGWKGGFRSWEN